MRNPTKKERKIAERNCNISMGILCGYSILFLIGAIAAIGLIEDMSKELINKLLMVIDIVSVTVLVGSFWGMCYYGSKAERGLAHIKRDRDWPIW